MQTWNRLTVTRGEEGRRGIMVEGKGTSQGTCTNGPRTWTTVWEPLWDREMGWVEEDKGENVGAVITE